MRVRGEGKAEQAGWIMAWCASVGGMRREDKGPEEKSGRRNAKAIDETKRKTALLHNHLLESMRSFFRSEVVFRFVPSLYLLLSGLRVLQTEVYLILGWTVVRRALWPPGTINFSPRLIESRLRSNDWLRTKNNLFRYLQLKGLIIEERIQNMEGDIGLVSWNHVTSSLQNICLTSRGSSTHPNSDEMQTGSILGMESTNLSVNMVASSGGFDLQGYFRLYYTSVWAAGWTLTGKPSFLEKRCPIKKLQAISTSPE